MEVNELLALKNHIKEFINKYDVESMFIDIAVEEKEDGELVKDISLSIDI